MSLSRQIQILAVDTGDFYSNKEERLHWLNHKLRREKNKLKEYMSKIDKESDEYAVLSEVLSHKNALIKDSKNKLLKKLGDKVRANENGNNHIRILSDSVNKDSNIISVFESTLTRMIGAEIDELSEDFMVVQVYYQEVLQDLIYNGYMYKGEKYIYFTSSAGQIRTKKAVFIKESVFRKYEKTIMCGLTLETINEKGGNNPNKYLAYLALVNSATEKWEEFDIDKTIVVDDFETNVFGTYDFIDDITYEIERQEGEALIPHMDGAGIMLPNAFGVPQRNKMVRQSWFKGLVGVVDFRKFIKETGASGIVKDIYGQEHDVIAEDIQLIFTKSQFKLWKFFPDYQTYKDNYHKYGCETAFTNEEIPKIKSASINYQMLQSLTDITEEEMREIASQSVKRVETLTSSIDNMKSAFGITPYNDNQTWLQKSIDLYPDLMNDGYIKDVLREIKNSMVKKYRSGALEVNGKYTFVLPDLYAFCEWLFLGIEKPKGLINNDEVFCWLFRRHEELDCLRSPHLYKEHAVRKNLAWNGDVETQSKLRDWFQTDAVYISTHDLISRILQLDRP